MTWALVNPAAGYRTFSGFEMVRAWPSISSWVVVFGIRPEDEDMLARQAFETVLKAEAFGLNFGPDFLNSHLVLEADRHLWIFLPVLEQDEPPARPQRSADFRQHLTRLRELMVDVYQQRQVKRAHRKFRIVFRSEHRHDVGQSTRGDVLLQLLEHGRLDIVGVNLPGRSDALGHAPAEVADSGPDIGHDVAALDPDGVEGAVRRFFRFPLGAHQPARAAHPHDGSDLAAGGRMGRLRESSCAPDKQQNGERSTHIFRIA